MRRIIVLSAAALLLAACQPEAPGGGESLPPADAPAAAPAPAADPGAAFRVDFSARGNEPFWRVDIKGTDIILTRPGAPPASATNAGLAATDDQAVWTAQAGATPVTVTVTKGDCSDGMSDLKYGYAARVVWGAETLEGCGFPTAEAPTEGQ